MKYKSLHFFIIEFNKNKNYQFKEEKIKIKLALFIIFEKMFFFLLFISNFSILCK